MVSPREEYEGIRDAAYRQIFHANRDIVFVVPVISMDQLGSCVDGNPAAQQLLGFSWEELQHLTLADIWIEGPRRRENTGNEGGAGERGREDGETWVARALARLHAGEETVAREGVLLTRDGHEVPARLALQLLQGTEREFVLGVARAVAAPRGANSEARGILEKQRTVLANIPELVAFHEPCFTLTWVNRAAAESVGMEPHEVLGRKCYELWGEPSQPCDPCPVATAFATGIPQTLERGSPDGKVWLIKGYPVKDETGAVVGAIEVTREITKERHLEKEILRAQKIESIGLLAGGIAHDFNNLLTAIMGNISMAREEGTRDEARRRQLLEEAERASRQAQQLTKQLLTFARGGDPVKEETSIIELVQLVEESTVFALHGSATRCKFAFPHDLWPVEVDPGQLTQVVHNLVLNADQATTGGSTIMVQGENVVLEEETNEYPLPPGKYIKLSVVDAGTGIPPEYLPKIFDPFFTTKTSGTGLGLPVCYSIVKKHGGHVEVASTPGEGTSVSVYLPASGDAARLPSGKGSESEDGTPPRADHDDSLRVLVMDDDAAIRALVTRMLERLGHEGVLVQNGEEAIRAFKTGHARGTPFDAVILDLTVAGGMGGAEAIRELRAIDPAVQAIVSSGYSTDPVMSTPGEYGFTGVLHKPYRLKDLVQVLQDLRPNTT